MLVLLLVMLLILLPVLVLLLRANIGERERASMPAPIQRPSFDNLFMFQGFPKQPRDYF